MSEAKKTEISIGHKLAIYLLVLITIASAIYLATIYFPEPKGEVQSFQTPDILIPTPFEEIRLDEDSSTDSGITILTPDATPSSQSSLIN